MERPERLLRRNQTAWGGLKRPAWCNPASPAELVSAGADPDRWALWSQDKAQADRFPRGTVEFDPFPGAGGPPRDGILWHLPREKGRQRMMAHLLASRLEARGCLWVYGARRGGIDSCRAVLEQVFQEVSTVDSAGHGRLLRAASPHPEMTVFQADDYRSEESIHTPQGPLQLVSWPGVFARGGLDEGTALLLGALPHLAPATRVLDFACGAGVIALAMLRDNPELNMTVSDSSALACHAARCSLAANRRTARIIASDGFNELDGVYDLVVTNPPFHMAHRQDPTLGLRLLEPVRNFLAPRGQLLLVANRHLAFEAWLRERFRRVERLAEDRRYRVLLAGDADTRVKPF